MFLLMLERSEIDLQFEVSNLSLFFIDRCNMSCFTLFWESTSLKKIVITIGKGTLNISLHSLRIPFRIEFGPTALQAMILLMISEISFPVTRFNSNKFTFELIR